MNKLKKLILSTVAATFSIPVLAKGLGAATDGLNELKGWVYGALALFCTIYMIYMIMMAMINKKQWDDVGMGVVYCFIIALPVVILELILDFLA